MISFTLKMDSSLEKLWATKIRRIYAPPGPLSTLTALPAAINPAHKKNVSLPGHLIFSPANFRAWGISLVTTTTTNATSTGSLPTITKITVEPTIPWGAPSVSVSPQIKSTGSISWVTQTHKHTHTHAHAHAHTNTERRKKMKIGERKKRIKLLCTEMIKFSYYPNEELRLCVLFLLTIIL